MRPLLAHGIGELYTLPVPLGYYLVAAGAAVALSFFVMARFLQAMPAGSLRSVALSAPIMRPLLAAGRVLTLLLIILTIAAGLAGTQEPLRNFAPVYFWVYLIIGFSLASLVVGNIWRHLNPFESLFRWLRLSRVTEPSPRPVPVWIAPALLLGLFWWEMVSGYSERPLLVGQVLLIYTLFTLLMASIYRGWFEDGEVFSAWFGAIGRLAFFNIAPDERQLTYRPPTAYMTGRQAPWQVVGVAAVILGGTSFDNLSETVFWFDITPALGLAAQSVLAGTVGLVSLILLFLGAFAAAGALMRRLTGRTHSLPALIRLFAWSLLPIAIGYVAAHYLTLIITVSPRMVSLLSDPFGTGADFFGTADAALMRVILGARAVWLLQLTMVVIAHVAGIWTAHTLALHLWRDRTRANLSQIPMAALMVIFTVVTLWLLSLAIVI